MQKMKVYQIDKKTNYTKKYGEFYESVFDKHTTKYSDSSEIIAKNVDKIYDQVVSLTEENKNLLLVGKVQSGKTSNLELLTALLFDNDYDLGIVYGGYDNTLLLQTANRFKDTFSEFINNNYSDESKLIIFNSIDNKFKEEQARLFHNKLKEGVKILIVTIKNHQTIKNLNNFIQDFEKLNKKAFIIDDEGDQATLNTEFRNNNQSSTYKNIVEMKKTLNNPLYLSITATPYAVVFQPEISKLLPEKVTLIEPGNKYYGPDEFHLTNENIILVSDDYDKYTIDIRKAFLHFLISSAIRYSKNKNNKSDMIIHMSSSINVHEDIKERIEEEIKILEDYYKGDKRTFVNNFSEIYNEKYFSKNILQEHSIKKLSDLIGKEIFEKLYIILQNSQGKDTQELMEYKQFKIFIGGELLQRGVTFPNLVTTYFTRRPKTGGNVDTTLQRARWLGYRGGIKDLMRIFTVRELAEDFSALNEIENDLWAQLYDCEKGLLTLNDIYVDLTEVDMNPSRTNVIDVIYDRFGNKWRKQRSGIFDKRIIQKNNDLTRDYISENHFIDISLARRDEEKNFKIYSTTYGDAKEFLNKIDTIFNLDPLSNLFIKVKDSDQIDFITMFNDDSKYRKRSFNDELEITNLHQGLDTIDIEKSRYLGDASAINDYNNITIQIFDIVPMINREEKTEYRQYMFAVYMPKEGRIARRR